MKTMTIRDVPDELLAVLKERARRNRRSLNQQVVVELTSIAGCGTGDDTKQKRVRAEEMIGMVEELRQKMKGFMASEEIDRAKREGRK